MFSKKRNSTKQSESKSNSNSRTNSKDLSGSIPQFPEKQGEIQIQTIRSVKRDLLNQLAQHANDDTHPSTNNLDFNLRNSSDIQLNSIQTKLDLLINKSDELTQRVNQLNLNFDRLLDIVVELVKSK